MRSNSRLPVASPKTAAILNMSAFFGTRGKTSYSLIPMVMKNTNNLALFGPKQLKKAARILLAYKSRQDQSTFRGYEVALEYNRHIGEVFLVDEGACVAFLDGRQLRMWHLCLECERQGFTEDLLQEGECVHCGGRCTCC